MQLAIGMLTGECTAVTQVALGHIIICVDDWILRRERMITTNTTTGSRTVFLVDDDSSTVDLYSQRLELAGFKTASALDAKLAAQTLANLSADLIILDLMLPKRSGFELLEAIRADDRHKTTPVLLLS